MMIRGIAILTLALAVSCSGEQSCGDFATELQAMADDADYWVCIDMPQYGECGVYTGAGQLHATLGCTSEEEIIDADAWRCVEYDDSLRIIRVWIECLWRSM